MAKRLVPVSWQDKSIEINGQEMTIKVINFPEPILVGELSWELLIVQLPEDLAVSFSELKHTLEVEGWIFDKFTVKQRRDHMKGPVRTSSRIPVFRRLWPVGIER